MNGHEPQPLDFREPRPLAAAQARWLQRWQASTVERLSEGWNALLRTPLRVRGGSIRPVRYRAAYQELPDPGVGALLELGEARVPTLFAWSSSLTLGVLAHFLGDAAGEWPTGRGLSSLEETMLHMLLQVLCESLTEGWPGLERLPCEVRELCRPRRSRVLPADSELIAWSWEVTCGYGTGEAVWLLPRDDVESLVETHGRGTGVLDAPRGALESIIRTLPLQVVVELGRADVPMSDVAQLGPGDVLVLDQPIRQSLTVLIDETPQWTGTPCRVGTRQAVRLGPLPVPR